MSHPNLTETAYTKTHAGEDRKPPASIEIKEIYASLYHSAAVQPTCRRHTRKLRLRRREHGIPADRCAIHNDRARRAAAIHNDRAQHTSPWYGRDGCARRP